MDNLRSRCTRSVWAWIGNHAFHVLIVSGLFRRCRKTCKIDSRKKVNVTVAWKRIFVKIDEDSSCHIHQTVLVSAILMHSDSFSTRVWGLIMSSVASSYHFSCRLVFFSFRFSRLMGWAFKVQTNFTATSRPVERFVHGANAGATATEWRAKNVRFLVNSRLP